MALHTLFQWKMEKNVSEHKTWILNINSKKKIIYHVVEKKYVNECYQWRFLRLKNQLQLFHSFNIFCQLLLLFIFLPGKLKLCPTKLCYVLRFYLLPKKDFKQCVNYISTQMYYLLFTQFQFLWIISYIKRNKSWKILNTVHSLEILK